MMKVPLLISFEHQHHINDESASFDSFRTTQTNITSMIKVPLLIPFEQHNTTSHQWWKCLFWSQSNNTTKHHIRTGCKVCGPQTPAPARPPLRYVRSTGNSHIQGLGWSSKISNRSNFFAFWALVVLAKVVLVFYWVFFQTISVVCLNDLCPSRCVSGNGRAWWERLPNGISYFVISYFSWFI